MKVSSNVIKLLVRSFIIIVVLAAVMYELALPFYFSEEYNRRLKQSTNALHSSFVTMANTTSRLVFNDPSIPANSKKADLAYIDGLIDKTRQELDTFGASAKNLKNLPGTGYIATYRTTMVTQTQANNLVSQSRNVLDEYSQLVVFFGKYNDLQGKLSEKLNAINAITDLNELANQGDKVRNEASAIRGYAAELKAIKAPADFKELQDGVVTTFEDTAKAYEHLAHGLDIAVDSEIYGAAAEIEAATAKNDADADRFTSTSDKSPILRHVNELPEKTQHLQQNL